MEQKSLYIKTELRNFYQKRMESDNTSRWLLFGQKFPKEEIVYFSQIIILYTIIICSIINITTNCERLNPVWISLLSSSVGYLLPHPKINKNDVLHNASE